MAAARYADLLARLGTLQASGVELGLERVRLALARLGDPQKRFAAVQIAGTNGKGSTAAMTEAILRAGGFRTGLYTSPHLARFTERIRIGGHEVPGDRLADLDRRVAAAGVSLTYFEVATVLGFLAMAEAGVEVAVLETGLGGRLDAVTTCEPLATAITSIGLDHQDYLGASLRAIAGEKAGILKPGVPGFVGRVPGEAALEIARIADRVGAPLAHLGRDFQPPEGRLGLLGTHQRDNAALALALAAAAANHLGRPLEEAATAAALAGVRWPGRLERLGDDLLLDSAHNAEGAQALAAALPAIVSGRRVVLLVSIVRDKDPAGIFEALRPTAAAIVLTRSRNVRARPPAELAGLAGRSFAEVAVHEELEPALARARGMAGAGGLVVVCGSMFLVGAVRAHFTGEPVDPLPTWDPVGGPVTSPPG